MTKPLSFSILAKGEGLFASYIPLPITERHTNSHGTTIIQSQCNDPRIPGHGDRLCLQQLHVTNDSFVKTLNSFNYKITLPVLLFKDMSTADFYSVWDTGYVLFCFFVTLFCIVITWVVAGIFYKNKSRLGELVQASYRSSAAVLGIAFIQNIYGNSGMAPLMIVGTVPLYNIAAVLILSFTGPDVKGFDKESLLKSLKGIITNPIIISIALGMLSSACRIHYPVIISKTVSNIAVLATPLALIGLGAGFEGKKALKLLAPTGVATVLKLVIWPALFLPLAVYFGFTGENWWRSSLCWALPPLSAAISWQKHEPRRNFDFQCGRSHHFFKFRYPDGILVHFAKLAVDLVI